MGSQGIVPLRNLTKRGLVLSTKKVLLERLFFEKKKAYYIGEFILFCIILNRTIPGIILSEIILSGDPLYPYKTFFGEICTFTLTPKEDV